MWGGALLAGNLQGLCWMAWLQGWPWQGGGSCFFGLSQMQTLNFRGLRGSQTCMAGVCPVPKLQAFGVQRCYPGLTAEGSSTEEALGPM